MKSKKKKLIVLASIFCLVVLMSSWIRWRPAKRFIGSEPKENELRVVTWNVGYFTPVFNKNLRDVDLDEISSVLAKISPDVVVLQELGDLKQADKIAENLGKNWHGYSSKTGHGEQVIAILGSTEFIETERFECGGRVALGMSSYTRTGDSLYVIGVHSPHPARGLSKNMENIRCALNHAANRKEDIHIVAGDMNFNFDTNNKSEFYSEILKEHGDGTIQLGKTYYAKTRIDHMFHYPKDMSVILEESGIIDLPVRFAKVPGFRDHRPIVVTYDLK